MIISAVNIFILRVVGTIFLLGSNVYAAQLLGVDEFGKANFILSAVILGAMLTVGGSTRFVTRNVSRLEPGDAILGHRYLNQAITHAFVFSIPVFLLFMVVVFVKEIDTVDVVCFFALLLLTSVKQLYDGYLVALSRPLLTTSLDSVLRPIVIIVCMAGFYAIGWIGGEYYLISMIVALVIIVLAEQVSSGVSFSRSSFARVHSFAQWNLLSKPFFLSQFLWSCRTR